MALDGFRDAALHRSWEKVYSLGRFWNAAKGNVGVLPSKSVLRVHFIAKKRPIYKNVHVFIQTLINFTYLQQILHELHDLQVKFIRKKTKDDLI